ncbi:MAG: YwiC-like family protein [Bifidobacteriaceae bacterium]|nr:YwiC-like family protein [Bifidobacteriaceae bacterium]
MQQQFDSSLSKSSSAQLKGLGVKKFLRAWTSNQPGAWLYAMQASIIALSVVGRNGLAWMIFIAWNICFLLQSMLERFCKSHGNMKYFKQVLVYGILFALFGLAIVVVNRSILLWVPLYIVLGAISCVAAWLHQERSIWSNCVQIIASCTMAIVMVHSVTAQYTIGLIIAVLCAIFQFGCVLFVKTMIRKRDSVMYLLFSIAWHVIIVIFAFVKLPEILPAALFALMRAVVLPSINRIRGIYLKPVVTGVVEFATTIVVVLNIIWLLQ